MWPAPTDVLVRAQAAGLPALGGEAFVEHIHAHLDVFVNGSRVAVPAFIGIDYAHQRITPLHTHDTTGIVHIESPDQRSYTLGQFFTEWGVRLDAQCVGSYCEPSVSHALYVDGRAVSGDPSTLVFHAHDEIALVVGAAPQGVPDHYTFPHGY